MVNNIKGPRIWELDFLKGIALILMVFFHVLYNLNEFYNIPVKYYQGVYYYTGKVAVIIFMLIAGISSVLSRSNIRRGTKLLLLAIAITLVTHLWDPAWGIKFGILHFLGISILFYPILNRINLYVLGFMAIVVIYAGNLINKINLGHDYLFPIGIKGADFVSVDYYPLIPWLGVFIIGIILGKTLYRQPESIFSFSPDYRNPVMALGRRTLIIYLLHQPLLLVIIGLVVKLVK